MTKLCTTCQTEQPPGGLFCVDCGQALASTGATQRLRVGAATSKLSDDKLLDDLLRTKPRARAAKLPQPAPVQLTQTPAPQKLDEVAITVKADASKLYKSLLNAAEGKLQQSTKPKTIGGVDVSQWIGVVQSISRTAEYDGVYLEEVEIAQQGGGVELTIELHKLTDLSVGQHVSGAQLQQLLAQSSGYSVEYVEQPVVNVTSWGDSYKTYKAWDMAGGSASLWSLAKSAGKLQPYGTASAYQLVDEQNGDH